METLTQQQIGIIKEEIARLVSLQQFIENIDTPMLQHCVGIGHHLDILNGEVTTLYLKTDGKFVMCCFLYLTYSYLSDLLLSIGDEMGHQIKLVQKDLYNDMCAKGEIYRDLFNSFIN